MISSDLFQPHPFCEPVILFDCVNIEIRVLKTLLCVGLLLFFFSSEHPYPYNMVPIC